MTTESSGSTTTSSLIQSLQKETQKTQKKGNGEIGKNEFLQMLVTQLKNQDPMNPMNGDEFAVNLAQFSQLEQLVAINGKLGGSDGVSDSASLASYLGHEVLLDTQKIEVQAGKGGLIRADLPADAMDVTLNLLDKDGNTVKQVSLGAQVKGEHSFNLDALDVPNGSYSFQLNMLTAAGGSARLLGRVGGVVDGFVPGPEPKLLIAGREVAPSAIKAVLAPAQI
jgi:flagellar basal-body rod modification protein FlgD